MNTETTSFQTPTTRAISSQKDKPLILLFSLPNQNFLFFSFSPSTSFSLNFTPFVSLRNQNSPFLSSLRILNLIFFSFPPSFLLLVKRCSSLGFCLEFPGVFAEARRFSLPLRGLNICLPSPISFIPSLINRLIRYVARFCGNNEFFFLISCLVGFCQGLRIC